MAVTEHAGGTGNDIESQALKDETMNNVYEDWIFLPLKTTTQIHPHQIVAVNCMVEKENGLEQSGLLADDCGTSKTLTALALICHQVNKFKQLLKLPPPGRDQWQMKMDDIKALEEKGQKVKMALPKPCWEVNLPTLILCSKPMVPEWENAIKKYTELKPHLHYGSKFWRANDHHEPIKSGHPWQYVVITTIETYFQRQSVVGYDRSCFWGPGRFRRVIIDEAHRYRVCGMPVGKTRRLDGTLVNTPAARYGPFQAEALFRLEPQFKWMLTATPLVNGIEDLRWVLTFLQRDSWLEEYLPPDTFDQAAMEPQADDWQPNEMNLLLSTQPDAEYTKIANPYQRGPRYGSHIHCITKAWDWYLLHLIESIGLLRRQTSQTQESRAKRKCFEQTVGESSFTILTTLMLRQTMVSRIPFDNLQPIINIPRMVIECQLVTYTEASGGRNFYQKLVDCHYKELKDSITGETADDDRQPPVANDGKKLIKRFQPRWQFIRIVALAPVLGPPTMVPETSRAQMLWESNKSDNERSDMTKVAEIIKMFATGFPGQTDQIPSTNQVKNMNHARFEAAMQYGALKLAWLKNWLRKNMPLGKNNQINGEKVILWMYWPIIQWFIEQVSYNCFAIHSAMGADACTSITEKFIQKDGVRVLVLLYMTSNEGLNIYYNCWNSILLEQGVNYAMEHQAWSRVRRIGQKYTQYTYRLVNMATID
ncbi:P-loop containing nucleoside triphosphate hydrolase protein [Trichophaea hybrida]|nr:P-loop containing nucleoside triphosphate hydrolase protein [Trichophaea hybrida]